MCDSQNCGIHIAISLMEPVVMVVQHRETVTEQLNQRNHISLLFRQCEVGFLRLTSENILSVTSDLILQLS